MANLIPISGEIKAQPLNDNFSSLNSQISETGSISSNTDTGVVTTPHNKQINVSVNSRVNSFRGQINAAENGEVTGNNGQINAGGQNKVEGSSSQINTSTECITRGVRTQINSSLKVINENSSTMAGGYAPSGDPLTANIKWQLFSTNGDIRHAGAISSGHVFSDFAELFPNLTGVAQGYGLLQTIDGYGVRPANEGESVIGVTSATAGIILGDAPFSWAHRWLKDEWGAYIYETIVDEEGEEIKVPKENPDWDPKMIQSSRRSRPDEWSVVGLIGQVYVRLKEDVQPMEYVKAWKSGVGQKSIEPTNIQVMKITQEYDVEKGYKIGFCLLK